MIWILHYVLLISNYFATKWYIHYHRVLPPWAAITTSIRFGIVEINFGILSWSISSHAKVTNVYIWSLFRGLRLFCPWSLTYFYTFSIGLRLGEFDVHSSFLNLSCSLQNFTALLRCIGAPSSIKMRWSWWSWCH